MKAAKRINDSAVTTDSKPPIDVPHHSIVTDDDDETMGYQIDGGEHEGMYYLVAPSETATNEWKCPVESCADVTDAWEQRNNDDIVSEINFDARLHRRAIDLDCSETPWQDVDSDFDIDNMTCDCGSDSDKTMSDKDTDMDFPVKSLTVDAVREKNEHVDERIAELTEKLNDAQNASEKLGSVRESIESADDVSLVEAVESLQNDREELQSELKEYREGELDELRQSIVDASDYETDELEDMEKSDLELIAKSLDKLPSDSDGSGDGDDGDDSVTDSSEFGLDESSLKTPTNDASGDGEDAPTSDFNPVNDW